MFMCHVTPEQYLRIIIYLQFISNDLWLIYLIIFYPIDKISFTETVLLNESNSW